MKKSTILLLVTIFLMMVICGCVNENDNTQNQPEQFIVNTKENIVKDQEFEGLQMTNTSLIVEGGISKLVTEVSNNTGSDYYLDKFIIIAKDKDGKVITTLTGYVGSVIPTGEVRVINSNSDIDLSNATSIEYSVIK